MKCKLDIQKDIVDALKTRVSTYITHSDGNISYLNKLGNDNVSDVLKEVKKLNEEFNDDIIHYVKDSDLYDDLGGYLEFNVTKKVIDLHNEGYHTKFVSNEQVRKDNKLAAERSGIDSDEYIFKKLDKLNTSKGERLFKIKPVRSRESEKRRKDSNARFIFKSEVNNILFDINTNNTSSKDVLTKIKKLSSLKGINSEILNEFINKSTSTIRLKTLDNSDELMAYNPKLNEILIDLDKFDNIEDLVNAFLHEVSHDVLHSEIHNPSNGISKRAVKNLNDIYKYYVSNSNEFKSKYGFTNIDEFIAEIISNKDFQDVLKEIDVKGSAYKLGVTTNIKGVEKLSLWDTIINALRKVLGINRGNKYNEAIDNIIDLVKSSNNQFTSNEDILFKKSDKIDKPSIVSDSIEDILGTLDRDAIKKLHSQYKNLMGNNKGRADKALPIGSKDYGFKWALKNLNAVKYKDSIVLGEWDDINGVFKTRINISPDSKTFLTEMIPYLSKNLDVVSFVPTDVALKYERSGYYNTGVAFRYDFKGEVMNKYLLASNENVIKKLFGDEDIHVEDVINLSKTITTKKFKDRIEDLTDIEDRLAGVHNKILDNLERQKALLKTNDASESFLEDVENTIETLSKYEDVNHVKGVLFYLRAIDGQMSALKKALRSKNPSIDEMKSLNKRYKDYLSYYSSISDIKGLYDSAIQDGVLDRNEKITNLIQNTEADYKAVENEFKMVSTKFITHYINDIKFHPKVSAKWTSKFEKEYQKNNSNSKDDLKNSSKRAEYIHKKMIEYKDDIDKDVKLSTDQLIYNKAFDITEFSKTWVSALETNSDMVQITQIILSETRDSIIKEFTALKYDHAEKVNNLIKSKNSIKASEIYKNIYEKDSKGNVYIKGDYTLEFKELNESLDIYTEDLSNITEALENEPNNKTFINEKASLSKKIKELNEKLYSIDDDFTLHIKPEFENDLSSLTKEEREARDSFIRISEMSTDATGINKSLITSIEKANFYKVPFVTKSGHERRAELNIVEDLKDGIKDKFLIRPDEIGFEIENADAAGNIKYDIPMHFRNYVDPKDQSLDLGTIYLKEAHNAISYKNRRNIVPILNMLIDVASSKDYIQTKGASQIAVLSKYSKREKDLTISGESSRTVERIKGLIENQIYDITKKSSGKIGNVDYHKIVGTVNGYTGMLGMSLNWHSAIVNYTGGYAQLLIQALGNDTISVKSLTKAFGKYMKDYKDVIGDLNTSQEISFTNQLNMMFDTFGGKNIGNDNLLQNKAWKKYANLNGLQFLNGMGEHQMQSVLTMAILDSVEALDKDGKSVKSKNGEGSTLLDNLSINSKGLLEMNPSVKYTDHSPTTLWEEGGRSQIQQLLKYKIFKTMGNYDDNLQPEIMKSPIGRLVKMYRRFLIPLMTERFQGSNTVFKKREDLEEKDKFFSYATKQYEEGNYVTFIRFVRSILPVLWKMKRDIVTGKWDDMSKSEQKNVKKSLVEFSFMLIFGIIAQNLAALADEDDDEALYLAAYTFSRMQSELMQFVNPKDTYRITKSPFASMRTIENGIEVLTDILIPFNWHKLNDEYKSGKHKGDYKIAHKVKKLVPVITQFDKSNKELYEYLNSDFFK